MSKIWICVESVTPPIWAVRVGNKWHLVKSLKIHIHTETRLFGKQPRMYLYGEGVLKFQDGVAEIFPTDKQFYTQVDGRMSALAMCQKYLGEGPKTILIERKWIKKHCDVLERVCDLLGLHADGGEFQAAKKLLFPRSLSKSKRRLTHQTRRQDGGGQ